MASEIIVEYERLYEVGARHLPQLARNLKESCSYLNGAATGAGEEPGSNAFDGWLFASTRMDWLDACKELMLVISYCQEALYDSGKAVRQIVEAYAATDDDAARAIANVTESMAQRRPG